MTHRSNADARRWVLEGTGLFMAALRDVIYGGELDDPTRLPGWTGRHVVAHVAANATALCNLCEWASTGLEKPMYPSPESRIAGIEAGLGLPSPQLQLWAERTADDLDNAMRSLKGEQWKRQVRTAQGRTVNADEIPWLRAREVMVHAVDLGGLVGFNALPVDFLIALIEDAVASRRIQNIPLRLSADGGRHAWIADPEDLAEEVSGSLADIAAFVTGRPGWTLSTPSGSPAGLPPWL